MCKHSATCRSLDTLESLKTARAQTTVSVDSCTRRDVTRCQMLCMWSAGRAQPARQNGISKLDQAVSASTMLKTVMMCRRALGCFCKHPALCIPVTENRNLGGASCPLDLQTRLAMRKRFEGWLAIQKDVQVAISSLSLKKLAQLCVTESSSALVGAKECLN